MTRRRGHRRQAASVRASSHCFGDWATPIAIARHLRGGQQQANGADGQKGHAGTSQQSQQLPRFLRGGRDPGGIFLFANPALLPCPPFPSSFIINIILWVMTSCGQLTLENQVEPILENVCRPHLVTALEKPSRWLPNRGGLGVIRPGGQKFPTYCIRKPVSGNGAGGGDSRLRTSTFTLSPYQGIGRTEVHIPEARLELVQVGVMHLVWTKG